MDLVQDEHVDRFLPWLPTLEGVDFCATHIEVYCGLVERGLAAQRLASDLSVDLRDGIIIFLLDAERDSSFDRHALVHDRTTSVLQGRLEQEARDRLAEAVQANTAVDAAARTWGTANRDARHVPIPDRILSKFIEWLMRRDGRGWRDLHRGDHAALDIFEGHTHYSLRNLDPALRPSVERLYLIADTDTDCSFHRKESDSDSEASTDASVYSDSGHRARLAEIPRLREHAARTRGQYDDAQTTYDEKVTAVLAAVAAAREAPENPQPAAVEVPIEEAGAPPQGDDALAAEKDTKPAAVETPVDEDDAPPPDGTQLSATVSVAAPTAAHAIAPAATGVIRENDDGDNDPERKRQKTA